MAERRASATWEGDLAEGQGRVTLASGAAPSLDVSWRARTSEDGETSPEELIAAAHAACFSMAFSNILSQAGNAPERIETNAVATFEPADGGFRIGAVRLETRGRVPGIDAAAFEDAASQAKDGCPVSQALAGNVEISVSATLES